jgi:ribosomal protein S18 acetylase RimI-like enzyme
LQEMTVIEANLDDPRHQKAVVEMINAYARDPMGGGKDLPADVCARLIPALRQHATTLVFLAFHGSRPIGVAVCFLGFSTFAARPLLNIHDLAVLPEYRGKGVGRHLLEQVESKGRELNCCKLTLEVRDDNHPAQQLYHKVGFGNAKTGDSSVRHWFLQKPLQGS